MQRREWPILVRFILWGATSRRLALVCVAIALTLAVAGSVYAYWDLRGLVLAPCFLGVLAYSWAIRWVDRHSRWH